MNVIYPAMSLLICIAHHYQPDKIQYLYTILDRFLNTYLMPLHIIIDSNTTEIVDILRNKYPDENNRVEVVVHSELKHPFDLTSMHRQHIYEYRDKYEYFMYVEDDMDIPYENFTAYLDKLTFLWPHFVPSFIRIEFKDGIAYNSEHESAVPVSSQTVLFIQGRLFIKLPNPYHAFWILNREILLSTLSKNFLQIQKSREMAASYPMWELKKPPLVELTSELKVHPNCYSYHLPNNYTDPIWKRIPLDLLTRVVIMPPVVSPVASDLNNVGSSSDSSSILLSKSRLGTWLESIPKINKHDEKQYYNEQ